MLDVCGREADAASFAVIINSCPGLMSRVTSRHKISAHVKSKGQSEMGTFFYLRSKGNLFRFVPCCLGQL